MGEWPKRRTLIIGARNYADLVRAAMLVSRFEEDVKKYDQKSGRRNGIIYTTAGTYADPVYVWYTTNQVTFYFNHSEDD